MTTKPCPSVLIDACIPRNPYERCVVLFDYLVDISEIGPHSDRDPASAAQFHSTNFDEFWNEFEDGLLRDINAALPDDLICTLGEFQPGDVVVREIGPDDEDPA